MAVGGWTFSKWFSRLAENEFWRKCFIDTVVSIFIEGNLPNFLYYPDKVGEKKVSYLPGGDGAGYGAFDSLCIDWEFPGAKGNVDGQGSNIFSVDDGMNMSLLMEELKEKLDNVGKVTGIEHKIGVAISGNPVNMGFDR